MDKIYLLISFMVPILGLAFCFVSERALDLEATTPDWLKIWPELVFFSV